jgi:hypothetical protein
MVFKKIIIALRRWHINLIYIILSRFFPRPVTHFLSNSGNCRSLPCFYQKLLTSKDCSITSGPSCTCIRRNSLCCDFIACEFFNKKLQNNNKHKINQRSKKKSEYLFVQFSSKANMSSLMLVD